MRLPVMTPAAMTPAATTPAATTRWVALFAAGVVLGGAATWLVRAPEHVSHERSAGVFGSGEFGAGESVPRVRDGAASRRADSSPLATPFVVTAHQQLAVNDIDAALQAVRSMNTVAERRAAALGLLDVLGADAQAGERIAAALPAAERDAFLLDRLERLTEVDAEGALFEVMSLVGAVQERAALRVAAAWARIDPLRAVAQSELLPADLQSRFRNAAWAEWAWLDPGAAITYFDVIPPSSTEVEAVLSALALSDPEGLLAIGERRPGPEGVVLRFLALTELGVRDPDSARVRVQGMAPGPEREGLVMTLALAMAHDDPEAALEWVDGVASNPQLARISVGLALVNTDPLRAFDLYSQGVEGQQAAAMHTLFLQQLTQDPGRARDLATALADRAEPQDTLTLSRVINNWLPRDPDGLFAWLQTRDDLDPMVIGASALSLANRDPAVAAGMVERVPDAFRDQWILNIASPYARSDPEQARLWVVRFQGQPVYDAAHEAIERQIAADADRAR